VKLDDLKRIVPTASEPWAIALVETMPYWQIAGMKREAMFIANVAHETQGLRVFDECLYYTDAERVRKIFAPRFDPLDVDDAWGYLAQPERFANRVYANRLGNGSEGSGDGWKFRGKGPAQLTGRETYTACAHGTGLPLIEQPELLLKPREGAISACWFWKWKGLAAVADAGDIELGRRKWNGTTLGLSEVEDVYGRALEVLS